MQVEVHGVQSPIQPSDHTYSTAANSSDQLPDTVIANRGSVLVPDDGDSFRSPVLDPLRNSDIELQSDYQICASITDQTALVAQL